MNPEQSAYDAGYAQGYQRALAEAQATIGPKFFDGTNSMAVAMKRRQRVEFWIRFAAGVILSIPGMIVFWSLATYANELQQKCSECLCVQVKR